MSIHRHCSASPPAVASASFDSRCAAGDADATGFSWGNGSGVPSPRTTSVSAMPMVNRGISSFMRPAHSDRHTPSFPHRLICAQASVNRNGSSAMAGCPAVASTCAYRNVGVSTTRVRIPCAAATICRTSSSLSTMRRAVSIKADFTWSFTRSISEMVVPRNTVPSGSVGRVSSLMKVREPSSSVRTINEGNGCRAPGVGRLRTRPTSIESGP